MYNISIDLFLIFLNHLSFMTTLP